MYRIMENLQQDEATNGESWRARAACAGEDYEMFFPSGSGREVSRAIKMAKAVCARCDVSSQCLKDALSNNEAYGIWGGATEAERAALVRGAMRRGGLSR